MSSPSNRSVAARATKKRLARGAKELAEGREEREQERRQADAEHVGRAMHERNAARLGRGHADAK